MNTYKLTPNVFEYIRLRCLGKTSFELESTPKSLPSSTYIICYSDQNNGYCFDYYGEDDFSAAYEGIISLDKVQITQYVGGSGDVSDTIEIQLTDMSPCMSESDYFMQSTLIDFGGITHQQLLGILAIREVLISKLPKWGVE